MVRHDGPYPSPANTTTPQRPTAPELFFAKKENPHARRAGCIDASKGNTIAYTTQTGRYENTVDRATQGAPAPTTHDDSSKKHRGQ